MSHLNGIQSKQLNQLNSKDGEAFTATSAPGWFIKGNSTYGEAFSPERPGNLVKFFTTGSDYFKDVASAIKNAKKSIFISGWQINYEVRLEGDTRLWDCLNHALRKKGQTPDIYLMPWLSPKAAVDTGDLETMVAAFILNAGLKKKKVWCLPAIQQSDMGSLGLFFSHHQKMVVIDNEVAYVGGIDLAYGRRDDNNFRLAADGRTANEFYNPCIPALKEIDPHQQYPYMTTVELISAALLEGDVLSKAQRKLAWAMDNKMFNVLRQAKKEVGEWFSDKGKDGMRLLGAGAAYSTGSVLYIAEFVKRQMTGDNLEAWKNTLRQWKVSLDGAVNTIDQEAQTLKKTDSTLTELRQEAKSISLAIGVWLEKPQEASAIQQRVEDWLVRAQQKVPMLTSMTQSGRARLQNQVGQLKSEVQMWVQRVTPQLDQLQQDLSTWATQIIKSGGQLTDKLLNEGSELTSLWIQQTGLGAFYAWINNTPSPILTAKALQELEQIATPFILYLHSVLDRLSETQKDEPYSYLADPATRLLPRGGMMLDDKTQPRMPWHDVHMRLEGSSVYDLSRNFIDRWNSLQARFDGKVQKMPSALIGLLKFATKNLEPVPFKAHYLAQPERVAPTGEMNVQVLRSAPMRMRNEERQGAAKAGHNLTSAAPNGVQANCLQAMLQAISGAQHFIYIENQFFQSEYGADSAETAAVTAGPMQSLMKIEGLPGYEIYKDRLRLGNLQDNPKSLANVDYFELARMIRNKEAETFTQGVMQVLSNQSTVEILKGMQTPQNAIKNPLCEALAERIERAIEMGENFHVYMVLPVHPEGPLNALNLMTQVHLTMQSLSLGEQSLIKRIQRAMAIKAQMDRGKTETQAIESIKFFKDRTETKRVFEDEDWSRYLTLLNLRSWEEINQQPVTEQIYIHSKLLIADDRIAILGSANINDRSQMGDRDSELAVVVAGSTSLPTSINGRMQYPVCPQVKQLRTDLWRKIFALNAQPRKNSVQPASDLEKVIATPAAAATWQAIQRQAFSNAEAYEQAFRHVPRNDASIWPLWGQVSVAPPSSSAAVKGASNAMPFEKEFWLSTMAGKHPTTVCGFITALPIHWTKYENNNSGFNLTILAKIEPTRDRAATSQHYAVLAQDTQSKERT
jgi:phosphatidylserine/phosphatidylglycerophosphate/cardiolipin synthase-like enzyme